MNTRYSNLVLELSQRWPRFRVREKQQATLMRVISTLLKPVNPEFLDRYATTIGFTIYMGIDLVGTESGYEVLRHEAVHVAQYARWRWLFTLSYLFALPVVFTMRAHWEFEAYAETIKVRQEERHVVSDKYLEWIADQFTGSAYLWMCPFRGYVMKRLRKMRESVDG